MLLMIAWGLTTLDLFGVIMLITCLFLMQLATSICMSWGTGFSDIHLRLCSILKCEGNAKSPRTKEYGNN